MSKPVKQLPRSPLTGAERTAALLRLRYSAPVGAGTDTRKVTTAGAAFRTM